MTTENTTTALITLPATVRLHHATKAKAEKLATMLAAEYPNAVLVPVLDEDEEAVVAWEITTAAGDTVTEFAKVPDLADVLEAYEVEGIDPTEGEEEEEEKGSSSVVDEMYRRQYREVSSNGQTCGDWLAEWLVGQTHYEGKLRIADLEHLFSVNGVDLTAKWAMAKVAGSPGWQGRYRMNGRQVLEKIVAKRGTVIDANGEAVTPPEAALADLRAKHAKWLAKEAKRDAAAEEVAKASIDA